MGPSCGTHSHVIFTHLGYPQASWPWPPWRSCRAWRGEASDSNEPKVAISDLPYIISIYVIYLTLHWKKYHRNDMFIGIYMIYGDILSDMVNFLLTCEIISGVGRSW